MNKYETLVAQMVNVMKPTNVEWVLRISDGEDLFKILKYGTDRANISDKLWEPLTPVDFEIDIKHEDVIIASTLDHLYKDAACAHGTLKNKLEIIEYPLAVFYDLSKLKTLYVEPSSDSQNQGIHFSFKENKKLDALLAVYYIDENTKLCKIEISQI